MSSTNKKSNQIQRQYILPKHITASNGLIISRQLTRWIQYGCNLESLILRAPSDDQTTTTSGVISSANHQLGSLSTAFASVNTNVQDGRIPPYIVVLLQDLILSKPSWKKIELTGKTPHATERILQSTMICRNGSLRLSAIPFISITTPKRESFQRQTGKNQISSNKDECVQCVHKLVVEYATTPILQIVADILNASIITSSTTNQSEKHNSIKAATIHTLALRWTDLSISAVQALTRGLLSTPISSSMSKNYVKPVCGLFLTGSSITEWAALKLLAQTLESCSYLEELSFSDCHLEDEEAAEIITALHRHPHSCLRSLDISCNFVQAEATLALAQLVQKRLRSTSSSKNNCDAVDAISPSPLSLDVSNQEVWDDRSYLRPLMEAVTGVIIDDARDFIGSKTEPTTIRASVETIDWSHNFLKDSHVASLCHDFMKSYEAKTTRTGLRKVVLRGNGIGDEGCAAIADALPALQQLHMLDLRLNPNITEIGVETLTSAFRQLHLYQGSDAVEKLSTDPSEGDKQITDGHVAERSPEISNKSLWHFYLDHHTQEFMMQLVLHRAGRSQLLFLEHHQSSLPAKLWPLVLERSARCLQPEIDSFDEEIAIHGITHTDIIFELFKIGHSSILDRNGYRKEVLTSSSIKNTLF